ncbi:hypothetical protein FHG87_023193 [Trinorchestia longiramus]|nr:hypothetical protein FHG87_023193 [Trinorchestia longiramus]
MFLLFPKTPDVCSESRPSDEGAEGDVPPDEVYVIPTPTGIPMTQTRAPPDGMSQRSVDNRSFRSIKSFKSAISSATFKTAVSGHRGTSFSTVYEDVADGMDMDEVSLECRSVALDSTDERQPHEGGLEQLEVKASYSDLLANGDRTSAWLQVHHNLDMPMGQSAGPHDPSVAPKPLPGLLF